MALLVHEVAQVNIKFPHIFHAYVLRSNKIVLLPVFVNVYHLLSFFEMRSATIRESNL